MKRKLISFIIICVVALSCVCSGAEAETATLYNTDGGTLVVYTYEVGTYIALGWYESPVVKMYSETGCSIVVYESEVEIYKSVGWHVNAEEVQTVLYAPGGRECRVFNYYVEEYLRLGWSKEKPLTVYYPGEYIIDYGVFANAVCLYFENDENLVYLYQLENEMFFDNYISCLEKDGWIKYYEDDSIDVKTVFLVDKTNTTMIAVSMNKSEPSYISIVRS